jgi:Phage P22-like portal protein
MARRQTDAEIIAEAKQRYERCVKWESAARANADKDIAFASGDSYNKSQWDQSVVAARGDRPCLTNNLVRQHNLLIVNDARQNKASIKVTPTGGGASYEAAQIFSGIVRRIEYESKAVDAYSTAAFHQVESGIGYVRVVTDYADDESFDLDLFIRRVANPKSIYVDPDAKEYDKSDMRYAFVYDNKQRDLWEAEHGDKFKSELMASSALDDTAMDGWDDKEHVREAEYWRRLDDTDTLHLLMNGQTVRESTLPEAELEAIKPYIVKSREIGSRSVEWFHITGNAITDRGAWLGKYIPIVPWIGEETVIGNTMDRKGHTRSMIDSQRMNNYWSSAAVEFVALQGKAPFIADAKATEGHEKQWNTANTTNWSVLYFNSLDDAGRPLQPPVRAPAPVMPQAYIDGLRMARDDLMMVSGQHQADLGMPGNERSGRAIDARQRQGELATAHYIDNQAKGIRQVGRILLDLIPKIYDQARVVKMMAEDGSDSDVIVQPNAPEAHQHVAAGPNGKPALDAEGKPTPMTPQQADEATADKDTPNPAIIFNPQIGRYGVEADVGPSYGTQRQEAANAFSQIMAQNPAAFQVVGDFWALNSDFPGADELAERLRKGLPPQYKGGPDPAVQQMQQQAHDLLGKADQEIADLRKQLAEAQAAAKDKSTDSATKDYEAETKRLQAVAAADPAAAQVIIRSMLSELLGMPALPIMHEHVAADAAHQQAIMPPPAPVNGQGAPIQ